MSKNQPKYLDSFNLEYDTQFIKDSTPKFRGLNQTFGRLNRIGELLNEEEVFVGPFAEEKIPCKIRHRNRVRGRSRSLK
ncbi:MAG: hypothetical protein CM15mV83_480 [uncultured marine virus]|nr:MAG: hypothetical protein CM15mV83_480 [uncultured marine virus]